MQKSKRKDVSLPKVSEAIIAILIGIAIFAIILHIVPSQRHTNTINQSAQYNIPNLNTTDIISVTDSPNYTAVYANRLTLFSPTLRNLGYLASSSSLFNFTGIDNSSTTLPRTIGVIVFLMNSSDLAQQSVNSMLFSNNANQSIRGYFLNSTSTSNFTSQGEGVYIYTISSIALFNTSIISSANTVLAMPDYQYTSIFSYNDSVGTVVTNGYTGNLNGTISRSIAEVLAKKLISENCCATN